MPDTRTSFLVSLPPLRSPWSALRSSLSLPPPPPPRLATPAAWVVATEANWYLPFTISPVRGVSVGDLTRAPLLRTPRRLRGLQRHGPAPQPGFSVTCSGSRLPLQPHPLPGTLRRPVPRGEREAFVQCRSLCREAPCLASSGSSYPTVLGRPHLLPRSSGLGDSLPPEAWGAARDRVQSTLMALAPRPGPGTWLSAFSEWPPS